MINVLCKRIGRSEDYVMEFPFDYELIEKIKELPYQQRKYDKPNKEWTINAKGIANLIRKYKGRVKDIEFKFESDKHRQQFINILEKHKKRIAKNEEAFEELQKLNAEILSIKANIDKITDDIDYTKFLKKGVTPYKYQLNGAYLMTKLSNGILAMDLGTGKAQPFYSKILTPYGYISMNEVFVGCEIINSDGKVSKITGVFPQGKKKIYRVHFSDKTYTDCCEDHLWTVQTSNHKKRNHGWFIYSLKQLQEMGIRSKCTANMSKWFIPIVNRIEFDKKELFIHPYIMGCLLGDGGLSIKNSINFTSADKQIINYINEFLPENHECRKNLVSKYAYRIVHKNNTKKNASNKNLINKCINDLNLNHTSHYKFIPEIYKFSSIEDRINLLQGLMDTDGTVDMSSNGCTISYTSVSKQLIDDISFIIQSLGGTSKVRKQKIDNNGFKSYTTTISIPPDIIPFKLTRKIERYKPKSKYPPYRMIREVEYIGEEEAQCISVDAPDNLYVTDNCILTHNTITSIIATQMNPDVKKVLCIVPASLKLNWQNEIHKYTNEKAYVIKYKKGKLVKARRNLGVDINEAKYLILNYDYFNLAHFDFNARIRDIGLHECDTIIFDEAHKLGYKGSNTVRNITQSFDKTASRRLLLTGTPIKNKLTQLFPLLKIVKPEEFSNESKFFIEYCGLQWDKDFKQWTQTKEPELEALNKKLDTLMFRVRKEDVLKDLPPMVKTKIILEMTDAEAKEYKTIEDGFAKVDWKSKNFLTQTDDEDTNSPIVVLNRLRQYLAVLKIKYVANFIEELNDEGRKVVLFDCFKNPLKVLKEKLGVNSEIYTGEQKTEQRQDLVDKFQNPNSELKNLLISMAAGNAGITLTQSQDLILNSQSYVPSENEQCYARIHRIGQYNNVSIFIPLVADTIDEDIYYITEDKQKMITKVIDGIDFDSDIQETVLSALFKKLQKQYTP